MIGYKLAVGVAENSGFFPVLVTLEIPNSAKVVEPVDGVICEDSANNEVTIKKYRTNECRVVSVSPFESYTLTDESFTKLDIDKWNPVAYSLYEILNNYKHLYYGITKNVLRITRYDTDSYISVSKFNENIDDDCGEGIHFFKDIDDIHTYYFTDKAEWFKYGIKHMNSIMSKNLPFIDSDKGQICANKIFNKLLYGGV